MWDDEDDERPAVGWVPVDGRGSMPYALLHGESLVAVASWALGDAGVELLDFTADWADVQARETALVVHDPLCPGTPVGVPGRGGRDRGRARRRGGRGPAGHRHREVHRG